MSYHDLPTRTFPVSGAISKHLRVKLSSGVLAAAVLADANWIGTMDAPTVSTDEVGTVRLRGQTHKMVASKSITAGVLVYTVAGGKVSDTKGTGAFLAGIALESAGADGDIIEVLPLSGEVAGS